MLVSQSLTQTCDLSPFSKVPERVDPLFRTHTVPVINAKAIFYMYAYEGTEFLITDKDTNKKTKLAFWESDDE